MSDRLLVAPVCNGRRESRRSVQLSAAPARPLSLRQYSSLTPPLLNYETLFVASVTTCRVILTSVRSVAHLCNGNHSANLKLLKLGSWAGIRLRIFATFAKCRNCALGFAEEGI